MNVLGDVFGAATRHNHKNSDNNSKNYAKARNLSNQNPNQAIKTKNDK